MDNLEEMAKSLENYSFLRLNQDGIENINRPIITSEIETVTKTASHEWKSRIRWLHRWILSNRKELTPFCLNCSKKLRKKYSKTHSIWPPPPWHQKQRHHTYKKRKLQVSITDEHRRKSPQQILAIQIPQYIKRTIYHDQEEFIPEMQGVFFF